MRLGGRLQIVQSNMYRNEKGCCNMNIESGTKILQSYVREGEFSSCPYLTKQNGRDALAVFTYYADEENNSISVYGFGQEIMWNGEQVSCKEKELFRLPTQIIRIRDSRKVASSERDALYATYYRALQEYLDSGKRASGISNLSDAFNLLISPDAKKMYSKICPEYIKLLS